MSTSQSLPGDAFEVIEGLLYAGPYPSSFYLQEAVDKAKAFTDLGIDVFVDLTEEDESNDRLQKLYPYAKLFRVIADSRGVPEPLHVRRPIPDMGVPTVEEMAETVELIESLTADGQTVYVHCWGGIGRTGTVLGCLAVNRGTPHDEVLDELARQRAGTKRAIYESPQTEEQRAFIMGWRGA